MTAGGLTWAFDPAAVLRAMDAAERRALTRMGAYVRRRARSSIRRRKAVSAPGSPPSGHTDLLRKLLLFAYDPATRSVVVGPAGLNKPGDQPRTLEFGGTRTVTAGRAVFVPRKPGRDRRGRFVTAGVDVLEPGTRLTYRPRPFMRPAEAAERPKFAGLFRNSLGG